MRMRLRLVGPIKVGGSYSLLASRLYRTEAIVLKSASLGENNLLVTLLARSGSKLTAVAWGGRNLTSKKIGHLEPLTRVDLALSRGRGGLDGVSQALSLEGFGDLKSNLETITKAIYFAELVDGFAAEGADNPRLYELFLDSLRVLQVTSDREIVVPCFQLNILKISGFMPELYQCVECRQPVSPGDHKFGVELGGAICGTCIPTGVQISPISLRAMKVLRYFDRTGPLGLSTLNVSKNLYEEVRSILDVTVRYWLDRDVSSRDFMYRVEANVGLDVTHRSSNQRV